MPLRALSWIIALACAAVALALRAVDAELLAPHAAHGIVSFEFCGFGQRCALLLAHWSPQARQWAAFSLGLDYLFLVLYPLLIGLWLWRLRAPRALLALPLAIALADAVENAALLRVLIHGEPGLGVVAATAASLKFALLALALLALAVLALLRWRRR